MLILAYVVAAAAFYFWMSGTAKEVASPLGVWVNPAEESSYAQAA